MKRKNNMFDYLDWRGDLTFAQSEFNEVDALILSNLVYLDFDCIRDEISYSFKDAQAMMDAMPDEVKYDGAFLVIRSCVELAERVVSCKRFEDMRVTRYVNIIDEEREIQFAAVTFLLSDGTAFVAFRGTDNNLVGWKEDFNMSFMNGVPSQLEATAYVRELLEDMDLPIRIGGHSKGGNLAIWAAAYQNPLDKPRILDIYSNDGPGFSEEFINSSLYQTVRDRIHAFVPERSVVGVMMAHDKFTTILSSNPTPIMQHDPFSWQVMGTKLLYDEERTKFSLQFEQIINGWMLSMTPEERETFIDNVYDIVTANNAKTLDDLDEKKLQNLFMMQKTFRDMGMKKQAQVLHGISKLLFNGDYRLKDDE